MFSISNPFIDFTTDFISGQRNGTFRSKKWNLSLWLEKILLAKI